MIMGLSLLVLAAGMGSRYGSLKQLDQMGPSGETVMDYSVFDALRSGFDRVVFVIRRDFEEEFKNVIGKRYEGKVKVEYAFQDMDDIPAPFTVPDGRVKPWGTGHALLAARDCVKDNFATINADDFYGRDTYVQLAKHLATAKAENGVAHHCMVSFHLGNTLTFGGIVGDGCFVNLIFS